LSAVGPIVSANGRLFSILDTAPIKMAKLRGRWQLIARDAFNGKLLWKRDIIDWEPIGRPYRTGPTQLHRRLVAVGDRVFATLQDNGPVTMLDAATGETLRTYEGTEPVQEIIYEEDQLFLVSGHESPDAIAFSESGETYFFERSQLYAHDPVQSFRYLVPVNGWSIGLGENCESV
jgi:outer membrane protein assembly factor BamB